MVELLGDFLAKAQNSQVPGIEQVRVVPEPNFHLEQMTKMVPRLSELFFDRPALLLTLDQPLFITCDEPVVLVTDGASPVEHAAACFKTRAQRKKAGGGRAEDACATQTSCTSTRPGRRPAPPSRSRCR